MIEQLAKACQPHAQKFDFLALESVQCLSEIAEFGPAGSAAGDALIPFLDSDNQAERAYGILTLGYINYGPDVYKRQMLTLHPSEGTVGNLGVAHFERLSNRFRMVSCYRSIPVLAVLP